jgi:predicted secreted protein
MEDNDFNRGAQSSSSMASNVLMGTLLGTVVLSTVLMGPLYLLVGMINQLQLVIHLPMISVIVPANMLMV